MALIENQSARFEDRKVRLLVCSGKCMWIEGLAGRVLEMPAAHAEGRPLLGATESRVQVVFRYADAEGRPTLEYPDNPNGASEAVAGVADPTGLVLGLMPHPERASLPAHYSQDGLKLFQNLIRWLDR